jgi:hypothetical protein
MSYRNEKDLPYVLQPGKVADFKDEYAAAKRAQRAASMKLSPAVRDFLPIRLKIEAGSFSHNLLLTRETDDIFDDSDEVLGVFRHGVWDLSSVGVSKEESLKKVLTTLWNKVPEQHRMLSSFPAQQTAFE